jgi:ankyrin repeat protein
MSVPSNPEFLRKEAKALLKQCRSGNAEALNRVRIQLHRMSGLSNARISETIKLADVHHAIARERGHESWGDLKREDSLVEQFLVAIRGAAFKEAQRTLAALPDMASESIHAACAIGDPEAVAHHLDRDSSLLNTEHGDWTPLLYTCGSLLSRVSARQSAGILECATLLLDRGADPNASFRTDSSDPESELSALRRAVMCGNMPVAMRLMQRGARPNLQNWFSNLHQQPVMGEAFREASREFFATADMRQRFRNRLEEMRQQQGEGPLWGSDKWWFHSHGQMEAPTMYIGMFRPLIERKTLDPNKTGINGHTMLHQAAQNGTGEMIELLLDHGADLRRLTPDGRTALVLAVRAGKTLNADALRARGATNDGLRPIDELVGACIRSDTGETRTILNTHPHAATQISAEDTEVLVRAAAMNILDRVKLMLACGFDPGKFGEGGVTALHAAAWHGHGEMVRLLLGFHAPVNSRDRTFGSSPLAWAAHGSKHRIIAEDDYCAIVNALIDAGADYESAVSRAGVRPEDIANEKVAVLLGKHWRS